jgi:hypothetical protein
MKNVAKQYNFIKKDMGSIIYSNWFKEVDFGFPNGFAGTKNKGLMVSKTKVVLRNGYGEKPLSISLKRFFPSEKDWSLIRLGVLPSLE